MRATLIAAIVGGLGGLTKSFIGIFKARARGEKIKAGYIVRTLRLSAVSGTIIGALLGTEILVSYIAGYVGSDIIEGIDKSFKKTKLWKKQFDI